MVRFFIGMFFSIFVSVLAAMHDSHSVGSGEACDYGSLLERYKQFVATFKPISALPGYVQEHTSEVIVLVDPSLMQKNNIDSIVIVLPLSSAAKLSVILQNTRYASNQHLLENCTVLFLNDLRSNPVSCLSDVLHPVVQAIINNPRQAGFLYSSDQDGFLMDVQVVSADQPLKDFLVYFQQYFPIIEQKYDGTMQFKFINHAKNSSLCSPELQHSCSIMTAIVILVGLGLVLKFSR